MPLNWTKSRPTSVARSTNSADDCDAVSGVVPPASDGLGRSVSEVQPHSTINSAAPKPRVACFEACDAGGKSGDKGRDDTARSYHALAERREHPQPIGRGCSQPGPEVVYCRDLRLKLGRGKPRESCREALERCAFQAQIQKCRFKKIERGHAKTLRRPIRALFDWPQALIRKGVVSKARLDGRNGMGFAHYYTLIPEVLQGRLAGRGLSSDASHVFLRVSNPVMMSSWYTPLLSFDAVRQDGLATSVALIQRPQQLCTAAGHR